MPWRANALEGEDRGDGGDRGVDAGDTRDMVRYGGYGALGYIWRGGVGIAGDGKDTGFVLWGLREGLLEETRR